MFRDFLSCDPLLFSAHPVRGLPCCLDYVSIVVDVPKSGIYDLWAAVEAPYVLGCRASSWSACSSFTPLTASRHTWHAEQIRRMRNGMGRPRNWIAADVVRVADGVLAEHWDVLQDEATRAESKSGLPMFGDSFAD